VLRLRASKLCAPATGSPHPEVVLEMPLNISVLEEIQRLQKDGENGVLVLSRGDERLSISYHDGIIQSVSSSLETHRLGTYLVREALLQDKDVLKIAAEARKRKIMLGE